MTTNGHEDNGSGVHADEVGTIDTPAEADRLVLEHLERAGADLAQPREVTHFLYFATDTAARDAAQRLEVEGFVTDAEAWEDQWVVTAEHVVAIDVEIITTLRERLTVLAESLGGTYDGWEATGEP